MAKPLIKNWRKHQRRQAERLVFEDLEPRVLLSGDPLAVAIADSLDAGLTEQPAEEPAPLVALMDVPEAPRLDAGLDPTADVQAPDPLDLDGVASLMDEDASAETSVELVFLDPHVEDYQQLIDGLAEDASRSFEVVILDAERDGIEQISEVLSSKEGIDAIHVISHGSEAGVQIGGTWLTAENLSGYATAIYGWGDSLDADADLLLYGCDLAASPDGLSLLEGLAELSGADVAASEDPTGSATLGGDWDLERQVGDIEAQIAIGLEAQQTWSGLLAVPTGTAIWSDAVDPLVDVESAEWDGTSFISTAPAANTGQYVTMVGAESPTRDEMVIVGMDASGTISAQMWDGTAWAPVSMQMQGGGFNTNGELATVTPSDLSSFAVVYQQDSGNAMLVWDNGSGGFNLSYSIWDGTSWKQEGQLNPSVGGNFVNVDLVASPNSDEVFLVGTTDANRNPDYAMYWDPTASAWYEFGTTLENTDDGFTDASVAYEQQSGEALIVYGDNGDGVTTDVSAKIWNGSTLTDISPVAAPAGITGTVEWTKLASDPNSDRIALAVRTTAGEGWVAVWNGTAWQTSVTVAGAGAALGGNAQANIDVAFEAESGEALVAYGAQNDTQLRYRTWDAVGGWSTELTDLDFGLTTNSLTLEAAPFTDGIALMIQDSSRELAHAYWDGDSWVSSVQLETSTGSSPDTQPFVFLWDQGNLPPEIDSHGGADTVDLVVIENSAAVTQVTATDPNGDSITYSLYGDDALQFTIDAAGNLSFIAAPDYENPQDLNGDNTYIVGVRVEDPSGGWDSQLFNVSVNDVEGHLVVVDTDSDFVDGDISSIEMLNANPGADGFISLREAILAANATTNDVSGPDQIWFDIATADHTITLTSALPNITDAVIIDGFSEPAYITGGQLIVEIDGSGAGAMQAGLVLQGGSSTIQGLVINNIDGDGILVTSSAAGSRIVGNFIGTDVFGETAIGNTGVGIRVDNAAGVQIGGTLFEERNIISGNGSSGILLAGAGTLDTVIQGNYIGVDIDGQTALGNGKNGIDLIGDAHRNLIEGNIIGGSSGAGIRLSGSGVQDNVIIGNYVGTNSSYDDLGNAAHGVLIESGASNNTVGDAFGNGNLIAYNKADGVLVTGNTSVGNSLLGNEIFANAGAEIKLDGGGNNAQAAPVLTTAEYDGAILNIYGELTSTPNSTFRIEFFVVSATNVDPSGAGGAEGYVYFDTVTTDNTGFVSFSSGISTPSVAVGDYITAIATLDNTGDLTDSSAFAQNIKITIPNNPPTTSGIADVTVDEDAPDTVIDLFAAFQDAEDADSALTFTLESISSPGLFAATTIDGLAGTLTLQYAADAFGSSDITVRATDTGGEFVESTFTVTVNAVNDAPTDLGLSNTTVAENADGAVVGTVSVSDPDASDTHTFTVDDARFEVVGGELKLKAGQSLDHETEPTVNVTITATDQGGAGLSYNESFSITVTDVNEPPTDLLLSNTTVAENADGAVVGTVSVSDPDASDTHTFTVDDARFEVVGGELKLKAGQSLDHETEPTVNVTITATDQGGAGLSYNESFTLTVTDVTELPTANIIPATYAADEQVALTMDGTGMQVSAPDAGNSSVTVTLSVGEGVINAGAGSTTVTVNNSGTGSVTLLGTVDQINALLDGAGTVEYFNGLDAPSTTTLTLAIDDGVNAGTVSDTATINIAPATDLPSVTLPGGGYNATEQTPLVLHGTGIAVDAPDAGGNDITVTLTVVEGEINVDPGPTGVGIVGSGSNTVTLSGSVSEINALLASDGSSGTIEYYNASDVPSASTTLTATVADGINAAVNQVTTIDIVAENDTPTAVNDAAYVVDEDGSLSVPAASGVLANDFDPEGDPLTAILVTGPSNAQSFTLNADGSFDYTPLADFNGTDSFTYTVNDGSVDGNTASAYITVSPVNDPPSLSLSTTSVGYTEDAAAPTVLDAGLTISDPDDTQLSAAQITITDFVAGDVLSFDTTGTSISGSYDGATGVLTLTGTDSIANYEQVLRTAAFSSTSDDPTLADTQTSRSLLWEIIDADADGSGWQETDSASSSVIVGAVNDEPTATILQSSYNVVEDTPIMLSGTGMSVADADAGSNIVQASLSAGAGSVFTVDPGTTGVTVSGSGTSSVTLDGTITAINDLLAGNMSASIYYEAPQNPVSGSLITLAIVDQGNTGTGGSQAGSDAASLNITAANDPPVVNVLIPSVTAQEDTDQAIAGISISDPDADTGDLVVTLSVSNGTLKAVAPASVSVAGAGTASMTLTGPLTDLNAALGTLVYRGDADYVGADTLTIDVNDQGNTGPDGAKTDSGSVAITVAAQNDLPQAVDDAFSVDEDSSISGDVSVNDTGLGDGGIVYAVVPGSEPTNGTLLFNLDGSFTYTPDADFNGSDSFAYSVTDVDGDSTTATVTLTVNPINDLPVAVDDAVSVDEDGIVSASVAGNDTGLGDSPVVYALVGGSGPNNGLLTFNADGSFIYAPDLNYSGSDGFSYTVTDANGDTATATVTLTINPLNDLPNPVDDGNVASEGGSAIAGNVLANDSSPDAPTTVTAADESGIAITIGTPYTTAAGGELALNSDGSYSYAPPSQGQVPVAGLIESFTYTITDGSGDMATAVLSITVDNSDLSLPQAVADAFTVTEGGSFDTLAGDLLASGSASVHGNDTGLTDTPISVSLVSDVSHGTLTLNADGSFVYTHDGSENLADGFTYRITDDDGQTSDASVSINVTPVNDNAPVVTSAATASLAEGDTAVLQVIVSDADLPGDTLSFGIGATGADGALFQIDGSGNLSFISAPDYEAPADANGDNVYEVGVEVFDGVHTTIQDISVSVTAVNDNAPVITSAVTAAVAEGDTEVLQVTASDADLPGDTLSFAIAGSGADDALFQIDGSGNLSFISAPDYENPADADVNNLYEVDVEVSDGVNTTTQSIAVDMTPVNDNAPVITSAATASVAEGDTAVLQVMASDADLPGDTLSFAVAGTGADGALFQIDASGNLSFISAPDYEAPADANGDNVYELGVEVSDGVNTTTQSITVNVTGVNDNVPVITSALDVSVTENTTAVTQVTATDDDVPADTLIIAIAGTGADDGLFQIDGSGNLSFIAAPDFENPADADANNIYEVDISVTDGVNTTVETLTVTVDDGNELPASPDQVFSISEGASNGTLVGQVTASDPEGGNLSFAIVAGDPSGAFAINATNGRITVADASLLDHETNPQVILTVEVTDDGVPALSVYPRVAINVTDVNEAPVDIGLWDPVTGTFDYSVEENTDSSSGAVYRDLVTSDPDVGDTHSYAIVGGADAGKFTLSGNRLTLDDGVLDYERQSSYAVTIRSTDAAGLFVERTLTLVVNNLNDAPVITSTASASIVENTTAATTLTATDQDGDTLSYFISGGADQALFAVDPVTGEVSFIAAPDYENPLDADVNNIYEVQVAAGDGAASASQLITVSVADGADAPSGVLLSNATVSGQTDTTGGLAVGTLSAVDDDAGDTASFSIVGGADAASFQVGGASGNDLILDDGVLDASVQSSYQVTVRATDSTSRTFDQTLVVTVEPYVPPVVVEPDPVVEPAPPPAEEPAPDPDPTTSETGSGETAAETATESLNEENTVEGGGIHSPAEDSGSTSDSPSAPAVNLADTDADAGTADTQVALADIPNFATAGLDSSAGLQGSASGFVGGTITDPNSVSQTDATVEVDPVIQQLVEPGEFVQELDEVRETVTDQKIVIEKTVVGSTVVASTGLSVGYVLWLVRGGVLISSLLSSLPAWRIIDPLPVLAYASDDDEDEESLESMVKSDAGDADKDQEELPEQEPPHRPAPQPSGAA